MYHFFVDYEPETGKTASVSGGDYNHIKNVLRMKTGEEVTLTSNEGNAYFCKLKGYENDSALFDVISKEESTELSCRLVLYQGLPKADKFETIIQKAVELGACGIVPVEMKRSIVKLDDKKKSSKVSRWQAISESAAKQSGRSVIPEIGDVTGFCAALDKAKDSVIVVPYESEKGMESLKSVLKLAKPGNTISVFIGPEGGFDPSEISEAEKRGAYIVSLGKRILRTETAGPAILAMLMLSNEIDF